MNTCVKTCVNAVIDSIHSLFSLLELLVWRTVEYLNCVFCIVQPDGTDSDIFGFCYMVCKL